MKPWGSSTIASTSASVADVNTTSKSLAGKATPLVVDGKQSRNECIVVQPYSSFSELRKYLLK